MSTVLIFEGIDSLLVGFTGSPGNVIENPVLRIPILNQERFFEEEKIIVDVKFVHVCLDPD
jgi:hypothetical protein